MGISKTWEYETGDNIVHTVVSRIGINRNNDTLEIMFNHYEEASRYVAGKKALHRSLFTFPLDVSSAVTSAMSDLKDAIEAEAVAKMDLFENGTLVKDNGDPLT